MNNREKLIQEAITLNENYRVDKDDKDLEIGFLFGTVEMIIALTLKENESFSELRHSLSRQIDREAGKKTYPVLTTIGDILI